MLDNQRVSYTNIVRFRTILFFRLFVLRSYDGFMAHKTSFLATHSL